MIHVLLSITACLPLLLFTHDLQDGKHWINGRINAVDSTKDFWYLSCKICARKVEKVDGLRRCVHCGEVTHVDIYRFSLEVEVVDDSGSATLVLSDKASAQLFCQSAENVVSIHGDSLKRLAKWMVEDMVGRQAVFEVVVTSEEDVNVFDCERLSNDEEILKVYEKKYIGGEDEISETESFLTDKVDDKASNATPVGIAAEIPEPTVSERPSGSNDPDATKAAKKRRRTE
ncbi:hypothetical protein CASFOL_017820 [Castilleja foliolosa]|uniref:Replication factor A C-terminal domain-containing protein n=1 Tax=Castilleja foliolosa TaxID=1961234 RepID=A0ABD3DB41_9LAMI